MATEGIEGLHIETRNYGATAAFWASLGYKNVFETDHGSGTWEHPNGGPYLFISEQHDEDLRFTPLLKVADAEQFDPGRAVQYVIPFRPEHWGVMGAVIADPDGRNVGLQAPLPAGTTAPNADEHHREKYGSTH